MVEKIFIISCIVYAIYYTMLQGEIFGFIRRFWDKKEQWFLNESLRMEKEKDSSHAELSAWYEFMNKLRQPIFDCPICMCPWWGTLIYWAIWQHDVKSWLICIFAAMGLNYIIMKLSSTDAD